MGRFRNPINWIREMSTSQISHLSNKELEEYSIRIPSDIARYISEVRPPDNMYPKKSTIEMLGDNRGEALKLWKDIIQGALKHQSEFESGKEETSEKWIKFLQNVLDKQGADAFSYENYKEGTGELSYMILDSPETIGKKIKGAFVEKPDPTKPELGKYKGGQVIPMYDGGMVQASAKPMYDGGLVVTDSLMAHGGQVNIDDFKTPARIDYPIGKEEGERRRTTTPKLEIERKIRENRVKAKLDLERKIKEEEKYIKQIKELGFTTVSAFKKAETEKARKANAAYWKKYGPMGNWKSETIQGRTGTEFVYPPGYSTKFKEGDQKIINEQEPLIKRARYLYNQKMKNKFNLEV